MAVRITPHDAVLQYVQDKYSIIKRHFDISTLCISMLVKNSWGPNESRLKSNVLDMIRVFENVYRLAYGRTAAHFPSEELPNSDFDDIIPYLLQQSDSYLDTLYSLLLASNTKDIWTELEDIFDQQSTLIAQNYLKDYTPGG
jgi:hypothetical protein